MIYLSPATQLELKAAALASCCRPLRDVCVYVFVRVCVYIARAPVALKLFGTPASIRPLIYFLY